MPKNKNLLIISIVFFLLLNTIYFWEGLLGFWAMWAVLILALGFFILSLALIYQIFLAIREKLTNRYRLVLIVIMLIILGTAAIKPEGFIDFEKLERSDLLLAERNGIASCKTILKLKVHKEFYIKSVCFGIEKQEGTYLINKDTVIFKFNSIRNNSETFKFGIIKLDTVVDNKIIREIDLYHDEKDGHPLTLFITKNDLIK